MMNQNRKISNPDEIELFEGVYLAEAKKGDDPGVRGLRRVSLGV